MKRTLMAVVAGLALLSAMADRAHAEGRPMTVKALIRSYSIWTNVVGALSARVDGMLDGQSDAVDAVRAEMSNSLAAVSAEIDALSSKIEDQNDLIAALESQVVAIQAATSQVAALSTQVQQLTDLIAAVEQDARRAWGSKMWAYDPLYMSPTSTWWDGFATWAEMPSVDGSFGEFADEGVIQRFTVTVYAEEDIVDHAIPVDAGGGARIYVDGVLVGEFINQHGVATVSLLRGPHQIDVMSYSGPGAVSSNWLSIGIGPCLWGTDDRILWVAAGEVDE